MAKDYAEFHRCAGKDISQHRSLLDLYRFIAQFEEQASIPEGLPKELHDAGEATFECTNIQKINTSDNHEEYRNSYGELHRNNGLPAITRADGSREWWVNEEKIKEHSIVKRPKRVHQ